jgi:hypothetical protein
MDAAGWTLIAAGWVLAGALIWLRPRLARKQRATGSRRRSAAPRPPRDSQR